MEETIKNLRNALATQTEKSLHLETELQGSFLVCRRLIKQVKSLKITMLCQEAAVRQKDTVTCHMKQLAIQNHELKL